MRSIEEIRRDNILLLEREHGSLKALAELLDRSESQVSQWKNGAINSGTGKPRGMRSDTARFIEQKTGRHQGWLDVDHSVSDGLQVRQSIDLDNNPEYPSVRRVRFKLSAGASGYGIEYQEGEGNPIVFRKDWFDSNGFRPEKLLAVRVANGSMEPGLYDGDIVIVNTDQSAPKDGTVFAANYEGEMVIKRLQRDAGEWWLCSDNADQRRYPRKVCHENVFLLGQVVYKQSAHI